MRPMIPRVAAIHDLSGFGRSLLCNVLPILSTMGIQACPVPTAVLSTHSGGFDGYTFRDLTEDIPDFIRHWRELVRELIHTFRTPDTWVVIDPVMGDGGQCSLSPSASRPVTAMSIRAGRVCCWNGSCRCCTQQR